MSRKTQIQSPEEAQSLVSRLFETVTRIDSDDLSGLAQMHGWCETLVEIHSQNQAAVSPEVFARAGKLTHDLEALILGEVQSAAEAFAQITAAVKEIAGSTGQAATALPGDAGGTAPIEAGGGPCDTSEWSDGEVAEGLEKIFEETPRDASPAPAIEAAEAAPAADAAPPPPVAATAPQPASPVARPAAAPETPPAKAAYVAEPLVIDSKEFDYVKGFVEEAREHIESIEAAVLEVERCPSDVAKIDDLFRPFHTIKGMAGFLNLRDVNCLTHEVETLLDQGRKGKRTITPGVIDLVLAVVDLLKLQVAGIGTWVASPDANPVTQPPVAEMIDKLRSMVAGPAGPEGEAAPAPRPSAPAPVPQSPAAAPPAASAPREAAAPARAPAGPAPEAAAQASTSSKMAGDQSIRIDTEKLDALIDMVGELVIAQTLVSMNTDAMASQKLAKDVTQVTKIVRDVQELAMAMRMVPIGPTFQKMARLVRDVSRKAGKQVNLTISGEDTELDKTVIQEIGDPLVHMVRNAVDHGIEAPDGRKAAGKPDVGEVHLHAGHEGGSIVISISDDGKGLNPAVLIAKGIEKGLVHPGEELSDQQAFALVFAPGFSTAAQVTDISGRGVGMDVVKRNIEQLRGRVEITSEPGKGTTFTIRLPLTLAIIDGMVIRSGGERFIIPTISIQQSLPRRDHHGAAPRRGPQRPRRAHPPHPAGQPVQPRRAGRPLRGDGRRGLLRGEADRPRRRGTDRAAAGGDQDPGRALRGAQGDQRGRHPRRRPGGPHPRDDRSRRGPRSVHPARAGRPARRRGGQTPTKAGTANGRNTLTTGLASAGL
jgi:two-component system chemotaxis sensor kinase CheA